MGRERGVKLSLKDWRKIEKELEGTTALEELKRQLERSLKDVRLHLQGKKRLKTAEEMLAGM